jgi:hypothetical protein
MDQTSPPRPRRGPIALGRDTRVVILADQEMVDALKARCASERATICDLGRRALAAYLSQPATA